MEGKIYSPEKGKFVSVKTKHGQKVLKIYNKHLLGGDKHHNCAYCKIVNPKTGKMVSTYGQIGGRVIKSYNMIGGLNIKECKELSNKLPNKLSKIEHGLLIKINTLKNDDYKRSLCKSLISILNSNEKNVNISRLVKNFNKGLTNLINKGDINTRPVPLKIGNNKNLSNRVESGSFGKVYLFKKYAVKKFKNNKYNNNNYSYKKITNSKNKDFSKSIEKYFVQIKKYNSFDSHSHIFLMQRIYILEDYYNKFDQKNRIIILYKLFYLLNNLIKDGFIYSDLKLQNIGFIVKENKIEIKLIDIGGLIQITDINKYGNFNYKMPSITDGILFYMYDDDSNKKKKDFLRKQKMFPPKIIRKFEQSINNLRKIYSSNPSTVGGNSLIEFKKDNKEPAFTLYNRRNKNKVDKEQIKKDIALLLRAMYKLIIYELELSNVYYIKNSKQIFYKDLYKDISYMNLNYDELLEQFEENIIEKNININNINLGINKINTPNIKFPPKIEFNGQEFIEEL